MQLAAEVLFSPPSQVNVLWVPLHAVSGCELAAAEILVPVEERTVLLPANTTHSSALASVTLASGAWNRPHRLLPPQSRLALPGTSAAHRKPTVPARSCTPPIASTSLQ